MKINRTGKNKLLGYRELNLHIETDAFNGLYPRIRKSSKIYTT